MSFLTGLSSEFDSAKAQVLSLSDISSLQDVFSHVLRTEITPLVSLNGALVSRNNNYAPGRSFNPSGNKGGSSQEFDTRTLDLEALFATIFSKYQESLKSSSPSITAIVDSGKTNVCLLSSSSKWVIDSGATNHMTCNSSLFTSFQSSASTSTVTLADGSPSQLTRNLNYYVSFFPDHCLFQDLMTKKIIGKGHESGGLYTLDTSPPSSIACSSVLSPFEAHCRLGHPSLPLLKKLCPQYNMLSSLNFHSDVWGPSPILSKPGFRYFVTFVDDYARFPQRVFSLIECRPLLSSVLQGEEPYTILFPQKSLYPIDPKIFGSTCFVRDVCPHFTKLDPKSLKFIFLGYSRLQKGYRCYCPSLNKYLVSIDVTFLEDTPYFPSLPIPTCQGEDDDLLVYSITSFSPDLDLSPISQPVLLKPPIHQVYSRRQPLDSCPTPALSSSNPDLSDDLPIELCKGERQCAYPISSFVSYNNLSSSSYSFIASLDYFSIPNTDREVISHLGWHNAMIEEMNALDDNGPWDLVNLPSRKRTISCKWVFMVKANLNGYSSLALHQLDIKNAFLHGDLQKEVYMEQPPGFVAQGELERVCRLQKSLYGLKQSPHAWFGKFSQAIEKFGMMKIKSDHSVFYK
ncbi:uncharacterized protein LOC133815489 [Humulus lupulus]|uniref:uncharacterized protein LOC133815489 n=1 Tax=Humulus lupulus TaxID=3486 RepID=UPI002B40C8CF|nr:uncharacterized protein LOC133815489 [Humulus lupulus]